jgi:hypothetical protein
MKGSQESLTTVVIKGWPTPNAADSLQGGSTQGNRKDPNLSIAVHGPAVPASGSTDGSRPGLSVDWRTPQANEAGAKVETLYTKDGQPAKPGQRAYRKTPDGRMVLQSQTINQQVEMVQNWQTATVSTGAHRQKDGSMIDKLDQQVNGKLNPRWVETLMGLPVGWTMPSCASPVTIERMNSDSSVTVLSQQQRNEHSEA